MYNTYQFGSWASLEVSVPYRKMLRIAVSARAEHLRHVSMPFFSPVRSVPFPFSFSFSATTLTRSATPYQHATSRNSHPDTRNMLLPASPFGPWPPLRRRSRRHPRTPPGRAPGCPAAPQARRSSASSNRPSPPAPAPATKTQHPVFEPLLTVLGALPLLPSESPIPYSCPSPTLHVASTFPQFGSNRRNFLR